MTGFLLYTVFSLYPFSPEIIYLESTNTDTVYYMTSLTINLWNSLVSIDFLNKKLGKVFKRNDYLNLLKKSKGQTIELQGDLDVVLLRVLWGGYLGQIGIRGLGAGFFPNKILELLAEGNLFNERYNFKKTEGIALIYSYIIFGFTEEFTYNSISGNATVGIGPILLSRIIRIDTLKGFFITTPEGITTRIHSIVVSGEDGLGLTIRTGANLNLTQYLRIQAFASFGVLRWSDIATLNIEIHSDSAFMRNIIRDRFEEEIISYNLTLPIELLARGYLSGKFVEIAPWVYYRRHGKLKSFGRFEYGLDVLTNILFRIGLFSSVGISTKQGLNYSFGISKSFGAFKLHLKIGTVGGMGLNSKGLTTEVFFGYKSSLI